MLAPNTHACQDENKTRWDMFIGLLIVYSIIVVPMQLAFPKFSDPPIGDAMTAVDYMFDFMFLGDIFLSLNTVYFSEPHDAYVTLRGHITRNYARTWMTIDVLSTVPFELVVAAATGGEGTGGIASVIKLIKVRPMPLPPPHLHTHITTPRFHHALGIMCSFHAATLLRCCACFASSSC